MKLFGPCPFFLETRQIKRLEGPGSIAGDDQPRQRSLRLVSRWSDLPYCAERPGHRETRAA